jgi:formyltetrahydrofolate deformylase
MNTLHRKKAETAVLVVQCSDQKGVVAAITQFLAQHNGNIEYLDQHVDSEVNRFLMRVEWDLQDFTLPRNEIKNKLEQEIGSPLALEWNLFFTSKTPRVAVFVSKISHCFYDLMNRWKHGELDIEIPLVISNHLDFKEDAETFGVDFYYLPITPDNKQDQERVQLELLQKYHIDFVVLARYMQIVSAQLIEHFPYKIINIHHSFLPAFPGAKPYHSAYKRGVKIIGATGHYVTEELDAGPIIEQDVVRVGQTDGIEDLILKGKDLEKMVLARAVRAHASHKTIVYNNRTYLFS